MARDEERVRISICMGNSCSAKGNNRALDVIQEYLTRKGLRDRAVINGSLCEGLCRHGPNIRINEKVYHQATPSSLIEILDRHFATTV